MKLQLLAAACVALSAAPAFAADAVTAKLAQPVAAKTKVIAGGVMFVCEADVCVAAAPRTQTFSAATCRAIAEKAGPVAAFTSSRASLEGPRLADCNKGARPAAELAKN